jgi:hypothetical protein
VFSVAASPVGGRAAGSVSDQIIAGEQHHTFATAGQVVSLDATGPCTDDLVWRLVGPLGDGLAFSDSCADLGPTTLSTTGTYTIQVYSDATATGAYAFVLNVAN